MNSDDLSLPLVSICILAFNHEKYIKKAIESALNQTYKNVEIIVVDNNSNDNTTRIIETEFENGLNKNRIHLYKLETNTYPSHGTNYGLSKASGKYICLLSGDDTFSTNKLQRQVEVMSERKLSNLFTWVNIINEHDEVTSVEFLESLFNKPYSSLQIKEHFVRHGNMLCALSGMFDREIFEKHGYFDERLLQLQDYDFWLRIVSHESLNLLPEKLTNYRVRGDQKNLSLNPSKETYLRTEFEEMFTNKHILNFDHDTLANVIGKPCNNDNKFELLFQYYVDEKKPSKAKGILLNLYEHLGDKIHFPSVEYVVFFNAYSQTDFFNSNALIEVKLEVDLKNDELARTKNELVEQAIVLKNMLNSTSWNVTMPLRIISRFLHGDWDALRAGLYNRMPLLSHVFNPLAGGVLARVRRALGLLIKQGPCAFINKVKEAKRSAHDHSVN